MLMFLGLTVELVIWWSVDGDPKANVELGSNEIASTSTSSAETVLMCILFVVTVDNDKRCE
jgi:hypothetical protein